MRRFAEASGMRVVASSAASMSFVAVGETVVTAERAETVLLQRVLPLQVSTWVEVVGGGGRRTKSFRHRPWPLGDPLKWRAFLLSLLACQCLNLHLFHNGRIFIKGGMDETVEPGFHSEPPCTHMLSYRSVGIDDPGLSEATKKSTHDPSLGSWRSRTGPSSLQKSAFSMLATSETSLQYLLLQVPG